MMYSKHFSIAVRVNGKILRENQGTVTLPFGSEYEILLKNLNSRRAMVKVSVDGQDATEGTRLILQPNASLTLERFIRNGNLRSGNRLKFIERTSGIESHRGIKEDDGLIRAEFWQEKEVIDVPEIRRRYYDEWIPVPRPYYPPDDPYWPRYPRPWWDHGITYSTDGSSSQPIGAMNVQATNCSMGAQASATDSGMLKCAYLNSMTTENLGITVPGSESNQQFHSASGFSLESASTVIILQLRGSVYGEAVVKPVTVDTKPKCSTCGRVNKATNKFCADCGTALSLI